MNQMMEKYLPTGWEGISALPIWENLSIRETYFLVTIGVIILFSVAPFRIFTRPPPVPLKVLPRRPALSILFKPEDTISPSPQQGDAQSVASKLKGSGTRKRLTSFLSSTFRGGKGRTSKDTAGIDPSFEITPDFVVTSPDHLSSASSPKGSVRSVAEDDNDTTTEPPTSAETPGTGMAFDLPDSFAPLLSSSNTEFLLDHLTADLVHGFRAEASVRLHQGRREIPLDKNPMRPQFTIDVPPQGIKISAVAAVGSDGFSIARDLDVTVPTTKRSRPMVKQADLVFDPPLPLLNVAPTLIHIPTLFEDNTVVPHLRRIHFIRYIIDFIIGVSSFIEKVLWILESVCQIHLSKVKISPLYKGRTSVDNVTTPEWRLSLSFSGHVLLFGWIPIPFISVILPPFVIPQPHALLEYLLSNQPLASARIRRENIAEIRIAMALLDIVDSWTTKAELVATPPAVGIDVTLSGGLSLGLELLCGRDPIAGLSRSDPADVFSTFPTATVPSAFPESPTLFDRANTIPGSTGSISSWTTNERLHTSDLRPRTSYSTSSARPYDANTIVPWKLELSAKGSMNKEKISFHLLNLSLDHEDSSSAPVAKSQLKTSGSCVVWKAGANVKPDPSSTPSTFTRKTALPYRAALAGSSESPSVAAILLFPEETGSSHSEQRMLEYDYAFDISEDSKMDSITLSVGGNHPMLNGGSMVTTILESIYAFGSVTARHNAVLDPLERRRKRNILRHLPAIDFTFGIQNSYIPPESHSYTDDGQTRSIPEMTGGRVMVRFLGGIRPEQPPESPSAGLSIDSSVSEEDEPPVSEGIKVVADFGVSSIVLNSETIVKEFPELEIFEGTKLRALTSSKVEGTIRSHLRPQHLLPSYSTTGPNIFNPLEAYEVDFSGSALTMKIKESTTSLGHRRIIIPTETTVNLKVVESIVDMTMEGRSSCELSWDFQGLSPILQVTEVGLSPEKVIHEKKEQVSLLVGSLRQGRLNFHVSPVGGINVTKAATSREDKEGLYDWKFFNALVSPDQKSMERLLDVIHDKRSMNKLLQVIKLINKDAHRVANYVIHQVWRVKEIFDKEGVTSPKHIIPGDRMARFLSLLICDSLDEVHVLLPMVRKVVAGDGLDIVGVKNLLHKHCDFYEHWTPEIDRAVRWLGTLLSPVVAPQPFVEKNVTPLAQQEHYASKFRGIPSAGQIYEQIQDRPHLPLESTFSNMVSRVAPYLSFHQIEYFLKVRSSKNWQPSDLKRLRYVYSVKKRVMDIAESYGGLSFLPQSFLVSVFLGEATRASLRAQPSPVENKTKESKSGTRLGLHYSNRPSTLASLRQRRARLQDRTMASVQEEGAKSINLSAAGRVASLSSMARNKSTHGGSVHSSYPATSSTSDRYELGDCLLGPADVAILLQAGLTSVMKGSSVVQLNQRMLLDLVASQPKSFAVAVLAEIGSPGGQGSPRQLTSALLALLELDQTSFRPIHRLDLHALLESWLPGLKVPKRDDYMAGGRWAKQSYYDAIFSLASSILEDAECYMALKSHLQRVRHASESDPVPAAKEEKFGGSTENDGGEEQGSEKLAKAINEARTAIDTADNMGREILNTRRPSFKKTRNYAGAVEAYRVAFQACAKVRSMDKLSFQTPWFKDFYKRNYDALMILSIFDNVMGDVDRVRYWMHCLRRGSRFGAPRREDNISGKKDQQPLNFLEGILAPLKLDNGEPGGMIGVDRIFLEPEKHSEQAIVEAIIDAVIYDQKDRERLKLDPLVRLLIPNPPGHYDFSVVTAMGVITDGKQGKELQSALERLERQRGVKTIRADTATARSLEYNASKIIEAIEVARGLNVPYGLLGYSQGCANALMAETLLYSGTPEQQREVGDNAGLVSRQLLFSAANASLHAPAMDKKIQRLIVQAEEFFKYQQGYFSRALQSAFLEALTSGLDSPDFHKAMGGAQSFLSDGCRAFWREAQHLAHVPTCTIRGVLEEHTTPEALEMLTNQLTKQSGSALHDSQVHVFDAVGHPVYHKNRNGTILEKCDVGASAIQRTHHWSPLTEEVEFITTARDKQMASFDCAKDRHVFPWVEVNARFGFIRPKSTETGRATQF